MNAQATRYNGTTTEATAMVFKFLQLLANLLIVVAIFICGLIFSKQKDLEASLLAVSRTVTVLEERMPDNMIERITKLEMLVGQLTEQEN